LCPVYSGHKPQTVVFPTELEFSIIYNIIIIIIIIIIMYVLERISSFFFNLIIVIVICNRLSWLLN